MRTIDGRAKIPHPHHSMQLQKVTLFFLTAGLALGAAAQQSLILSNAPPDPNLVINTNAVTLLPVANMPTKTERVLSLKECLKLALDHNLAIQIQKYNPIINEFNVKVAYDVYEPVFSLTADKTYADQAGGIFTTTGQPFPSTLTESDNYTPGITGITPWGLNYDLNAPWSRQSIYSSNYWLAPNWQSSPLITLTQPLLKNFWIDSDRLTIQLNKAIVKSSLQDYRLTIITTVTSVKESYFNLISARLTVDADAKALQLAQQLANEDSMKVQVGTLAPLDQRQAESQAAASQALLLNAQNALVTQENNLKILLTENYTDWANVSPRPADETLVAVPQSLDRQDSWHHALTERPEYLEDQINIEKQNITLKYDFNQGFPQLDLTGSYGRNAYQPTLNQNFDAIGRGAESSYSYGITLSYPLGGNQAARNTYKAAKATKEQLLLTLKQEEESIMGAVENDLGAVQSDYAQVKATHEAPLYAQDALTAEQIKLQNGTSTSFNVLTLISDLLAARLGEIQALASYNIALAQLDQDEGITIEANNLGVEVK